MPTEFQRSGRRSGSQSMVDPITTPVLFLIFRQPEVTKLVFDQIRAARPKKLYISADGPREDRPGEDAECEATRAVVANIDWDCEVRTRFLPRNLGLKKAVSSALDWFFEAEEEGIILEYDCLPDPSFFSYCQVMLERYRNDTRVFSVTGNNIQAEVQRGDGDYYFSRFTAVWGWAAWRRSWTLWRPTLENFELFVKSRVIESVVFDKAAQLHWTDAFKAVHEGRNRTTWAFNLLYAQLKNGTYCIVPNRNLVRNIGFGAEGTNAIDADHPLAQLKTSELRSYVAPTFFVPDVAADTEFSLRAGYSPPRPLIGRIRSYASRRLRRLRKALHLE